MSVYESDDETAEAVRQWWRENGKSVIAGAVLGLAAVFGWKEWRGYVERQAVEASMAYDQVTAAATGEGEAAADRLILDHGSSVYASLAALEVAKRKVAAGDNAAAEQRLRWVIDHAGPEELRQLARFRLARVLADGGKADEALGLLGQLSAPGYLPLVEELKGDIHRAKGEKDQAREAYRKALAADQGGGRGLLQMKLDDLGG